MKFIIYFFSLFIVPIGVLISIALFIPYTGYELVKLFINLARQNHVQVLKTSVEQIPLTNSPEIVTVEFITDQDTFYKFRTICNKNGIWFLRPIWDALDAYKWVYSVNIANRKQ